MTPQLLARLIAGARAGSLTLTRTEATTLLEELTPAAAVIVHGRPVELRKIPWHVLPDTPADLPELDPWRRQVHESLVEGLIDGTDQRRLFRSTSRREPRRFRRDTTDRNPHA